MLGEKGRKEERAETGPAAGICGEDFCAMLSVIHFTEKTGPNAPILGPKTFH